VKRSSFTCNEVTFLANFSTFTSLLSLTASRVTSTPHRRRFYCRARIVLQSAWHLSVSDAICYCKAMQLPQQRLTCWILDTGPIPGLLCVPRCGWLQIVSIRRSASGLTDTVSASCSAAEYVTVNCAELNCNEPFSLTLTLYELETLYN